MLIGSMINLILKILIGSIIHSILKILILSDDIRQNMGIIFIVTTSLTNKYGETWSQQDKMRLLQFQHETYFFLFSIVLLNLERV